MYLLWKYLDMKPISFCMYVKTIHALHIIGKSEQGFLCSDSQQDNSSINMV